MARNLMLSIHSMKMHCGFGKGIHKRRGVSTLLALSLPLLQAENLPLGLQLMGFRDADAALFAAAGYVQGRDTLGGSLQEKAGTH